MVVTPLVFIMIGSFIMENTFILPVVLIFSVCALMLVMAVFFFNRIEKNWAGESFLE